MLNLTGITLKNFRPFLTKSVRSVRRKKAREKVAKKTAKEPVVKATLFVTGLKVVAGFRLVESMTVSHVLSSRDKKLNLIVEIMMIVLSSVKKKETKGLVKNVRKIQIQTVGVRPKT